MDQEKIGIFIEEKRKQKKLTQQQLAQKIGVSNRTISNWENGKCMPEYDLLIPLTKELEISISELITGEKLDNKNDKQKNIEKLIKFLKNIENKKEEKYKKIGISIFITGLLIIVIVLLFIPSNGYMNQEYIKLGFLISTIGLLYKTQKEKIIKVVLKNISYIIVMISLLLYQDYISITKFKFPPRYYNNYENRIFTGHVYYQTLLYDVYACETDMYHSSIGKDYKIVKKDTRENAKKNLKKYCNLKY